MCSTQLKAQCSSGQLKLENLTSCDYDYRIMWDTPTYCNCSAYIDNGTINAYSTLCLNYTCGYTTPEPFFIDLLMVSPTTTACNLISCPTAFPTTLVLDCSCSGQTKLVWVSRFYAKIEDD